MDIAGKIIVVTGGGSGIGAALCRRFTAEGAKAVVVVDLNGDNAEAIAAEIGGTAHRVDVSKEEEIIALIDQVENEIGPIDLFCSNAGIGLGRGLEATNEEWDTIMAVNVYSHLYAARALVPRMIARGGGYLLNTASAAGLLAQIGSITYSVTKHAAVSLAEWLSITHGNDGIRVSVLAPQAVNTPMIANTQEGGVAGVDGVIEPEELAQVVVEGLADERFHILPHPVVGEYMKRKADDVDRWLAGMRKLQARYGQAAIEGVGD